MAELTISSRIIFSSSLTFIRTSLGSYRVGVVRASDYGWERTDVKSLTIASKAILGVNANFFDPDGRPLGLVVSKGVVHQKLHRGGATLTGVFTATKKGIFIVNRQNLANLIPVEAVQAGPRLLSNGAPVEGIHESLALSKRAGICIDRRGRLIFFAVSSRFIGLDIEELQNVLVKPEIGCVDALNLDGGGSAQLYVHPPLRAGEKKSTELYLPGDDLVPVMLALFPAS